MKKLFLILAIAALSTVLFAQTENLNGLSGLSLSILHTDASVVFTEADCNGDTHVNNDADALDISLPPARDGLVAIFYDKAGGVITIDAATGDEICLDGTDLTAGYAIDSPGNAGDFICLKAIDNTHWISLGRVGTWIDGGAD